MNPLPGTTPAGTKWAYALMVREAGGETLVPLAAQSWREVLGFPSDISAKKALEQAKERQAA